MRQTFRNTRTTGIEATYVFPLPARAGVTLAGEDAGRKRFLVLVTDGQVAGEDQILRALAPVIGDTRVFALGIDRAVNEGFLRRLAALGAGRCDLVESEDRLDEVMAGLHRRITPPLVTGPRVEAAGAELLLEETTPSRAPDLIPGAPCTVSGRWRAEVPVTALPLTVHGDGGFRHQVVAAAASDRAVRTCWARARVRDLEDRYAAGGASPELADRIIAVSLGHRVLSRFTAFIAVDRSRAVGAGAPQPVIQPVELPHGWAPGPQAAVNYSGAGSSPDRRDALLSAGGGRASRRFSSARPGHEFTAAAAQAQADLASYLSRAVEIFDRAQRDLDCRRDLAPAATAVDELADDLESVGCSGYLPRALRELARALRWNDDPRPELAAVRRALTAVSPNRREWWR